MLEGFKYLLFFCRTVKFWIGEYFFIKAIFSGIVLLLSLFSCRSDSSSGVTSIGAVDVYYDVGKICIDDVRVLEIESKLPEIKSCLLKNGMKFFYGDDNNPEYDSLILTLGIGGGIF